MALKDIKIEDVLTTLGIDITDAENVSFDGVKKHVGESYILRSIAEKDEDLKKKIVGNAFGKISTKTAQLFDLKDNEVKDNKLEDVLTMIKGKYDATIADLTEKATKGNDKKVEDLTKKIGEYESKIEANQTGFKALEDKYNTESKEWSSKLTSYKLNDKLGKVRESIKDKLTDDYHKNPLIKTGFDANLSELFDFELDEKDEVIVKSKKDNKIVMSKNTTGHYATPDEVILGLAEEKGVFKKNNAKGSNNKLPIFVPPAGDEKSKVHPKAREAQNRPIV